MSISAVNKKEFNRRYTQIRADERRFVAWGLKLRQSQTDGGILMEAVVAGLVGA